MVEHLNKRSAAAGEGGDTFVWGKKIDQQLHKGVSVKEITAKLGRDQIEERRVSGALRSCSHLEPPWIQLLAALLLHLLSFTVLQLSLCLLFTPSRAHAAKDWPP